MDLFSDCEKIAETPRVLSVTELTRSVRDVLETNIGAVWVEGEISNLRKQASGHQYFTLKDAQCQLPCVLFARPGAWRKQIPLSDGMCVQARGALTVYEARGQYQLNVQLVQAAGAGLLQAKFEALKRRLDDEGLFDADRKRALPKFPTTLAIVTSPTGAALRDMLNILARRAPWVRVLISPVRVQGSGAGKELADAVAELNRADELGLPRADVIVVTRGGGSMEDLWEFNDERLARAIFASEIPVVSAVGHEIDFTIADFVSDLRAPTPSAAAELVTPDTAELLRSLAQAGAQMRRCAVARIQSHRNRVAFLARDALFAEPRRRLDDAAQRLDFSSNALVRSAREQLRERMQRVAECSASLRQHRPDHCLALRRQELATVQRRLLEQFKNALVARKFRVDRDGDRLRLLSPLATLRRGYSLTERADGALLTTVADCAIGDRLITRLADGSIWSTVEKVE